jgi:chromosome segregation ATPase
MCNKPGPGKGKRSLSSAQGIGQLGERQSEVNQQTRTVTQRLTEQMRLSSSDREQMRKLAEEQARIRAELEEIKRSEEAKQELLGRLDQTQKEMKEVEEILKSGGAAGDELEEKQTRILSRLLDAQRSVNRRDYDPQRESRPGEDVSRASPAELPAELLRQSDRFRQDLLKSELDRYPAQYRAFVEAYLRQLNGSRR